jgi:hypothetical protein
MRSAAHEPRPPALDTAIEREGADAPAMGANRIGARIPNRSQNSSARLIAWCIFVSLLAIRQGVALIADILDGLRPV